jgi:hypothetical protein
VPRATLSACEALNVASPRGSSTTKTRIVSGGRVAAILPAVAASVSSSGPRNPRWVAHDESAGHANAATSATPIAIDQPRRVIRRQSQVRPSAASSGTQNANVSIRSGGNQRVRTANGTATTVMTSQAIRNRRTKPPRRPTLSTARSSSTPPMPRHAPSAASGTVTHGA